MALDVLMLPVGQMAANCYIVSDPGTREALIVDPGDDAEYIEEHIARHALKPTILVATHGHFDHIMAAYALQHAYTIPFLIHPEDVFLVHSMKSSAQHFLSMNAIDPSPSVTGVLKGRERLVLGKEVLVVMEVPGHTPGSIVLYSQKGKWAIVGDTMFAGGGMGRTDFSYSDKAKLAASLSGILALPPETVLYPGHGEATTVAAERKFHASAIM